MPKVIELTVELDVQKVSCPGVWLCQDGRVSLTVFTLGTSYQTGLVAPVFPLAFRDVFYFRKTFQETCALNNICCLLQDETIYCELVQWCNNCRVDECTVLAQYLGALNDILFPSNMCSNEGVDLLMRRSKEFPGILSPKIEIATKVRIDELWTQSSNAAPKSPKHKACSCKRSTELDGVRQKQVCHTPLYHRVRCTTRSPPRSGSRSRSLGSKSHCSLTDSSKEHDVVSRGCPTPPKSRVSACPSPRRGSGRDYAVYNVQAPAVDATWLSALSERSGVDYSDYDDRFRTTSDGDKNNASREDDRLQRQILESQYIDQENSTEDKLQRKSNIHYRLKMQPCVCDICKRYHELFHR